MDFDIEFDTMMSNQEKFERAYQKGKWDERRRILDKLAYQEERYGNRRRHRMTPKEAMRVIFGRRLFE